jgi:hypothetical protein
MVGPGQQFDLVGDHPILTRGVAGQVFGMSYEDSHGYRASGN